MMLDRLLNRDRRFRYKEEDWKWLEDPYKKASRVEVRRPWQKLPNEPAVKTPPEPTSTYGGPAPALHGGGFSRHSLA